MSDLLEYMQSHIPEHWFISNLINLEPEWQANICDGEHVAVGTGATPEEALLMAGTKAEEGVYIGRLASLERLYAHEAKKVDGNDLLSLLGMAPAKKPPIQRRM